MSEHRNPVAPSSPIAKSVITAVDCAGPFASINALKTPNSRVCRMLHIAIFITDSEGKTPCGLKVNPDTRHNRQYRSRCPRHRSHDVPAAVEGCLSLETNAVG